MNLPVRHLHLGANYVDADEEIRKAGEAHGKIIVSVFGTVIYAGSAAEYPQGLAVWVASPLTKPPDYTFTPLHPNARQAALVLAYRRYVAGPGYSGHWR